MTMQEKSSRREEAFNNTMKRLAFIQIAGLALIGISWALRACGLL